MFRTSTEWRQLELRHASTGAVLPASMRIISIAGRFNFQPVLTVLMPGSNSVIDAYYRLFGGSTIVGQGWVFPPAPCVRRTSIIQGDNRVMYFTFRTADTPCMRPVRADIRSFRITNTVVTFEVQLPRPQLAPAGHYSATQTYTVGPGQDIDFGDAVVFSDPELVINLQLEVDPLFKVEFPGGSNLLSLEPEGGWLNWINRGRKPTRLWREQNFNLSTSIPFKVSMQCEHVSGDHCAIAASDGHEVPVEIRMTLPAGMQDAAGQPVRGYLLNRVDSPHFTPVQFILARQATLHFEVPKANMESMLDHAGKAYNGSVTIIWDPQI